jgi:hypothetical protein
VGSRDNVDVGPKYVDMIPRDDDVGPRDDVYVGPMCVYMSAGKMAK